MFSRNEIISKIIFHLIGSVMDVGLCKNVEKEVFLRNDDRCWQDVPITYK